MSIKLPVPVVGSCRCEFARASSAAFLEGFSRLRSFSFIVFIPVAPFFSFRAILLNKPGDDGVSLSIDLCAEGEVVPPSESESMKLTNPPSLQAIPVHAKLDAPLLAVL